MPLASHYLHAGRARLPQPAPSCLFHCLVHQRVWEGAVRPCILPQSLLRSAGLHWFRPYCNYQCLPPRPRRIPRATMQASGGIASSPTAKRQKTGKTEAANGHTPCSGTNTDPHVTEHQHSQDTQELQAAADVAEAEAATAVADDAAASSSNNGLLAVANGEQRSTPTAADLPSGSPGTPDAAGGADTTAVDAVTTAAGCGDEGTTTQVATAVIVMMSPAELHQAGRSIFDQMQKRSTKPLELAYTALARMAATAGDGDAALEATTKGLTAGVAPKLRGFVPALLAYAVAGEPEKAFQVADLIQEQKLDLTESEFALLLQACARGAASWQSVKALLSRMTKELTRLQPETLAAAEQYFRSDAALAAVEGSKGKGRGCWVLEPCTVSETGQTSNCGGQLQALDLEDEEWEQFASGIAQLAAQRERKPKDFKVFQAWLEQHGPVQALVDGANVALYGQNWERGAFSFGQIKGVMDQLGRTHPDLHPLMMLHMGRTKGPAAECKPGKTLLADLKKRHAFYATPTGSNDDWYWMYAAVKAGPKGLLISNDEMRDHMFQLLAPRFFHKWKQRHQVKFTFDESGLHLYHPAVYTICAQGLTNGSYVFPAAQGSAWLSARLQFTD
ncbi:hypothetical protein WJX82_002667 [Trebouxia sp. C0006]